MRKDMAQERRLRLAGAALSFSLGIAMILGAGTSTMRLAATAAAVPSFDHIFVVLEENHGASQIVGSASAPYINSLIASGASATKYSAVSHPSLPNYMALTSGQTFDSVTNSDCNPTGNCVFSTPNLGDRLDTAGKSWKGYMESMPGPCTLTNAGNYAVRHNPFVYYTDMQTPRTRCIAHDVPYTDLKPDLATAAATPNFVWITPDVCSDMHSCPVGTGDNWLASNLPAIFASPAWKTQRSLLILTWDESEGGSSNQVETIALGSPNAGVRNAGFTSATDYTHYSLLKTIETSWNMTSTGPGDAAAMPMADFFGATSPPPTASPSGTPKPTPAPTATPTSTPTPHPTATPTPTRSPEPTAKPSPEPTTTPQPTNSPAPTESPQPTATANPTPKPRPSPTAEPTPTAPPTTTAEPSHSPVPSDTPAPTATASPVATARPTPTQTPTESPVASPTATATPSLGPTQTVESTATPAPAGGFQPGQGGDGPRSGVLGVSTPSTGASAQVLPGAMFIAIGCALLVSARRRQRVVAPAAVPEADESTIHIMTLRMPRW